MAQVLRNEVDYTELSSFIRCKRKWYYRFWLDLVPFTSPTALEFGIAMHEALDALYKNDFNLDAMLARWEEVKDTFKPDMKRNQESGERILRDYYDEYKVQVGLIDVLHNEVSFVMPIEDIVMKGRIDRIISWAGSTYVMDHKTTTMLGKYYFEQYFPHWQIMIYTLAGKQYFDDCSGAYIDALFVGKASRFERRPLMLTDYELEAAIPELLEHVHTWEAAQKRLLADTKSANTICPRSAIPEACAVYSGCEYKELCRLNSDPSYMDVAFTKSTWDCAKLSANKENE